MRDLVKFIAGILLAVLLLVWVMRGTDPHAVWEQLRHASIPLMVVCVILNTGHNVFRVWRWRALLTPFKPGVRFLPMFSAVIIGYTVSWIVPGRLGELVRPMLLSSREDVPLGPALGSVVGDRLFDGLTVVALFVAGTWITPLEGEAQAYAPVIRTASLTMAAVVFGVTVAMMLASASSARFARWLDGRARPIRWAGRTMLSVSSGVDALRSPRLLVVIVVQSLLAWFTICWATWFGIRAAGAEIGFGPVLVVMPLLVLGVAVPTPGGAGSYHGAMKVGLMLFGVVEAKAVAAGFLMHFLIVVPTVVLGFFLIWLEGLSWKDLVASASELRRLGAVPGVPIAEPPLEKSP